MTAKERSQYRRIDAKIWNDGLFVSLPDDTKLLFLFLLLHPNLTTIGGIRNTLEGIAAEMRWSSDKLKTNFRVLVNHKRVEVEQDYPLIVVSKYLKYNPPHNPQQVRGFNNAINRLPECHLMDMVLDRAVKCVLEENKNWVGQFDKPLLLRLTKPLLQQLENLELELELGARARATGNGPSALTRWSQLWEARHGEVFIAKSRHGAALKRLETKLGTEELEKRMSNYLDHGDDYTVNKQHPLELFVTQINQHSDRAVEARATKTHKSKQTKNLEVASQRFLSRNKGLVKK